MRIGAAYPQTELGGNPESIGKIGRAVEELGFDHFLIYDHVVGAAPEQRDPPRTSPTRTRFTNRWWRWVILPPSPRALNW
jgi:hypothetical protein